jgi:hypothetical protein
MRSGPPGRAEGRKPPDARTANDAKPNKWAQLLFHPERATRDVRFRLRWFRVNVADVKRFAGGDARGLFPRFCDQLLATFTEL